MIINGSHLNSSSQDLNEQTLNRPPWVTTTLGCFLIFTIVVDILGNLLVIFSVYRNKKLRNAGEWCKHERLPRQSMGVLIDCCALLREGMWYLYIRSVLRLLYWPWLKISPFKRRSAKQKVDISMVSTNWVALRRYWASDTDYNVTFSVFGNAPLPLKNPSCFHNAIVCHVLVKAVYLPLD